MGFAVACFKLYAMFEWFERYIRNFIYQNKMIVLIVLTFLENFKPRIKTWIKRYLNLFTNSIELYWVYLWITLYLKDMGCVSDKPEK